MNVILGLSHFDRTYDATCKIGYAITSNLDVKIAFFFFIREKRKNGSEMLILLPVEVHIVHLLIYSS